MMKETRDCAPFSRIVVEEKIDVRIVRGDSYKLEFEGGRNWVPVIVSEVRDKVLSFKKMEGYSFFPDEPFAVTVHIPENGLTVDSITALAGKVILTDLPSSALDPELRFTASGPSSIEASLGAFRGKPLIKQVTVVAHNSGSITLSGSCYKLTAYVSSGVLMAESVNVEHAVVTVLNGMAVLGDVSGNLRGNVVQGLFSYRGSPLTIDVDTVGKCPMVANNLTQPFF